MKNTLSKDKNMVEYSFKLKYTTDTGTASPWEIDWSRVMPLCIVMLVIHGLRARNISVHTGIRQLLITYIYHAKTGANQSASFSGRPYYPRIRIANMTSPPNVLSSMISM